MNINELISQCNDGLFWDNNSIIKIKPGVYKADVDGDIIELSMSELRIYLDLFKDNFKDMDRVKSTSKPVVLENKKQLEVFLGNNFKPDAVPNDLVIRLLDKLENNQALELINDNSIIKTDSDNYLVVIQENIYNYSRSELINYLMDNLSLLHGVDLSINRSNYDNDNFYTGIKTMYSAGVRPKTLRIDLSA